MWKRAPTRVSQNIHAHMSGAFRAAAAGGIRTSKRNLDHSPYHESLPEGVVEDAFFNRFILVLNAVDGWD